MPADPPEHRNPGSHYLAYDVSFGFPQAADGQVLFVYAKLRDYGISTGVVIWSAYT